MSNIKLLKIDYNERLKKIREAMVKNNMSAILAYGNCKFTGMPVYIADYTLNWAGYESIGGRDSAMFGSALILIPLEGDMVMLTDLGWDVLRSQEESKIPDTRHSNNFGVDMAKIINDRKIRGVIGIEPWLIFPAPAFLALTGLCQYVTFGPTGIIQNIRRVKTPAEIQRMREAERITELGLVAGMNIVKEGLTEHDLCNEVEYVMKKHGDLLIAANSLLGTGVHTDTGSASPSKYVKIQKGDLVQFDLNGRYEGYCGDVSRVKMCGEPSKEIEKLFNAVLEMNVEIRKAAKPGAIPAELFKLGARIATDHGFKKENIIPNCGHGVGVDIHEPPDYGKDETPLEKNMLITVEPCLVMKGVAGIRIEDMILITDNGNESLSTTPYSLK